MRYRTHGVSDWFWVDLSPLSESDPFDRREIEAPPELAERLKKVMLEFWDLQDEIQKRVEP